ncbi:MAG: hypothetical protein ACLFUS_10005 [Candidatus Sumerlaeia bacterium]
MFKHIPFRATPIILMMALVLGGLVGCQKQRANYSLEKAKKNLANAIEHNAEQYNPEPLNNTKEKIEAAQSAFTSQNFEQALEHATTASELSKNLLEDTKAKHAADLREQSSNHVRIATLNDGSTIDPERYNTIVENDKLAQEAFSKQKYDRTIELAQQVQADTDILLSNLKMEAEEKLREAKGLLEELVSREYGRDEAPQYVTDTEAKIEEMEEAISYESREYKKASKTIFPEIESLVKTGIHEARRSRSKKKIAILEEKLLRARFEGAQEFNADFLASTESDFAAINKNFFSENFVHVLDAADLLEPRLDRLILETRIRAAEAAIDKVVNAIASLEADKADQYVPQGLEKMKGLLKDAREAFNKDLFDEVKRISGVALDEKEIVLRDFNNLAVNEIRDAKGALDSADSLLQQMGHIFEMQAPKSESPQRNAFENSKKALKTELEELAKDSSVLLGVADVQRQSQNFSNSIESARQVVRNSNWITHEVFHVVAHNNVMQVSEKAQQIANNGGSLAPEEMEKLTQDLEKARNMIKEIEDQGQVSRDGPINPDAYKPSVAQTAVAKASYDSTVQRVKHVANEKIDEAEAMIALAESHKAETYDLGGITSAKQVAQQAKDDLQDEKLLMAAKNADSARNLAMDSNLAASQGWATEQISGATQQVEMAQQAGSDVYAPMLYKDARQKVSSAQEIYRNASQTINSMEAADAYLQAKDLAFEARQSAEESRLDPVTNAQQDIVRAKHYNAEEYDFARLLEAIVLARKAMDALENKNYESYLAYSSESSRVAQAAASASKSKSASQRVKRVDDKIETMANEEGGIFFNVEGVYEVSKNFKKIRKNYSAREFEELNAQLDNLEEHVAQTAGRIPTIFETMITRLEDKTVYLVDMNAMDFAGSKIDEAKKRIRWAKIDYGKEDYSNAYDNMKRAMELLNSVQTRVDEMDFVDDSTELIVELEEIKGSIKPLMRLSPDVVLWTASTIRNSAVSTTPRKILLAGVDLLEFRRDMDEIYIKAQAMEYPVTMEQEYNRLLECVRLARESSFEFEKFLILNHYDYETVAEVMTKAYNHIEESEDIQVALSVEFERKGLQGRLAKYNRIIGE